MLPRDTVVCIARWMSGRGVQRFPPAHGQLHPRTDLPRFHGRFLGLMMLDVVSSLFPSDGWRGATSEADGASGPEKLRRASAARPEWQWTRRATRGMT